MSAPVPSASGWKTAAATSRTSWPVWPILSSICSLRAQRPAPPPSWPRPLTGSAGRSTPLPPRSIPAFMPARWTPMCRRRRSFCAIWCCTPFLPSGSWSWSGALCWRRSVCMRILLRIWSQRSFLPPVFPASRWAGPFWAMTKRWQPSTMPPCPGTTGRIMWRKTPS